MFEILLIAVWHNLSDVKLAEALDDRASFRHSCGFAGHEPTPERTSFVRFRKRYWCMGHCHGKFPQSWHKRAHDGFRPEVQRPRANVPALQLGRTSGFCVR